LKFYNDEEDHIQHPAIPPKPRRRPTTKNEEEYCRRVAEWEG
jgi:ribosomal protein S30